MKHICIGFLTIKEDLLIWCHYGVLEIYSNFLSKLRMSNKTNVFYIFTKRLIIAILVYLAGVATYKPLIKTHTQYKIKIRRKVI